MTIAPGVTDRRAAWRARPAPKIRRWRGTTFMWRSRRRRRIDGIELAPQTFDWLCEQGHVGLERVAKARRDATLVAPVTAALETLSAICARLGGDVSVLRASRENLLLAVDLVHAPTAHADRGRRPGALHVVSPRDARALPGRLRRRVRPRRVQGAVPLLVSQDRRPRARSRRQGVRVRRRPARAGLPRRAQGSRDAGDGPPAAAAVRGRRRRRRRPPTAATGTGCSRCETRERRPGALRRPAPGGSSVTATLTVPQRPQRTRTFFVIWTRVHRDREHVAALDAHVVVGPVAAKDRPRRILLERGARRRTAPRRRGSASW